MTTIKKIIQRVDRKIVNSYNDETKLEWIASLDGKIAMDVMLMDISEISRFDYSFPEDLNTQPLVQFPYDDLYDKWIGAQIAAQDEEWDRYANNMEVYNAYYEEFVNWFLSTYRPGQGHMGDGSPRPGVPTYYITAYGLAVMKGFRGTLEEWFASLKGQKGDRGDPGAKIRIGTVETVESPAEAYATITGTAEDPVLNLGIPKQAGEFLLLSGGTMKGSVDMSGYRIQNLAEPAEDRDAVTKKFIEGRYETEVPKAAGDANAGESSTFSRGDHVHPAQENCNTATKLKKPVTVQTDLSATEAASFDGSEDVKPGVTGVLGGANGGLGVNLADVPANAILRKDGAGRNLADYIPIKSGALYAVDENGRPVFGVLPIALGGTGAATAAEALKNLGALPLAGGTITGELKAQTPLSVMGKSFPTLSFKRPDGDDELAGVRLNVDQRRVYLLVHNADMDGRATRYKECYMLPVPDAGLTEDKWYSIITTKNPAESRSLLEIGCKALKAVAADDGSTAYENAYGNYSAFVVMGAPAQNSSRVSIVIPAAAITTEQVRYQISDSTDYVTFYVWRSGTTLYIKKYQGNGSVLAVYGMN